MAPTNEDPCRHGRRVAAGIAEMTYTLANDRALVTAAGQGLGEEIARTLARAGARTLLVDINAAEAERVAREINAEGGTAAVFRADVTRAAEVAAVVKFAEETWGGIDILVNAAGGFERYSLITEISDDEWDQVLALNLKSAFLCARAVAKGMMDRKKGRIINIASLAGVGPNPYGPSMIVPYGTAKAAVIGFTKHLAKQLGPYAITVNAVSPGTTLTPRVRKARDAAFIEKLRTQNAMSTLVEPRDTAEAVLFLASSESRYITGVNLNVNAGTVFA
jgi:NAD(P)-dependent dehydrogenase (short-subunit alcohol dehydrogenase family)